MNSVSETTNRDDRIRQPNIYCDTNTLAPNIRGQPSELEALMRLRALRDAGKCSMCRSRIVCGELDRTLSDEQRDLLKADYELLDGILKDLRIIGFHTIADQLGGSVTYPLGSDIQDEKLFEEIYREIKVRVPRAPDFQSRRDSEHLTQAICNSCDVFLTCDRKTIIRPLGQWLEQRYPPLKVRLPSC